MVPYRRQGRSAVLVGWTNSLPHLAQRGNSVARDMAQMRRVDRLNPSSFSARFVLARSHLHCPCSGVPRCSGRAARLAYKFCDVNLFCCVFFFASMRASSLSSNLTFSSLTYEGTVGADAAGAGWYPSCIVNPGGALIPAGCSALLAAVCCDIDCQRVLPCLSLRRGRVLPRLIIFLTPSHK